MNWTKAWCYLGRTQKTVERISPSYHTINRNQNGVFASKKILVLHCLQSQSGCLPARSLLKDDLCGGPIGFQDRLISSAHNTDSTYKLHGSLEGNSPWSKQSTLSLSRKFGHKAENDSLLTRDFLVQLWVADRKMKKQREKGRRKIAKYGNVGGKAYDNQHQYGRWYSGSSLTEPNFMDQDKPPVLTQPPLSQSVSGLLKPQSPEEVSLGVSPAWQIVIYKNLSLDLICNWCAY